MQSPEYQSMLPAMRSEYIETQSDGLQIFDHHRLLPPLIMQETDSWKTQLNKSLSELSGFQIPYSSMNGFWKILVQIMSFFGILFFAQIIKLFLSKKQKLILAGLLPFKSLVQMVEIAPKSYLVRFAQYIPFEVILQLMVCVKKTKSISLANQFILQGHEQLFARVIDSIPDTFFIDTFANLSEEAVKKIMPHIQRPERFKIARQLALSVHNFPHAIVELMKREEWMLGINNTLKDTIIELESKKNMIEQQIQQLDMMNIKLEQQNLELKNLTTRIKQYLPKQLIEKLLGETEEHSQTKRKKLTIFFSDLVGFTETTESLESETLTSLLNSYLDRMEMIASRHGGTVDKFIGDAIVIFFGDSDSKGEKQDAIACVKMAIEMQNAMLDLQQSWRNAGIEKPLKVRMGVNTGYCTVGDFGSNQRKDYTVIGSQVNLTARLQAVADPDTIIISYSTYALIKDEFTTDYLGELSLKGIPRKIPAYRVNSLPSDKKVLSENMIGFSLHCNPDSVAQAEREKVLDVLKKAIELVEKKSF